jgi:hypothetical protein
MVTSSGEILHPSLTNYRVGREIERHKREGKEEMRKEQRGDEKSSKYEITPLLVVGGALSSLMPPARY